MNCYYTYDKQAGKVLIPGCWAVVHSNDIRDCTCKSEKHKCIEERVIKLESTVLELKKQINILSVNTVKLVNECDNPHCIDGVVDEIYGEKVYCSVCNKHS